MTIAGSFRQKWPEQDQTNVSFFLCYFQIKINLFFKHFVHAFFHNFIKNKTNKNTWMLPLAGIRGYIDVSFYRKIKLSSNIASY